MKMHMGIGMLLVGLVFCVSLVHSQDEVAELLCFDSENGTALFSNNDKVIDDLNENGDYSDNVESCKTACLQESEFTCRSFDFVSGQFGTPSRCFLSASSGALAPGMLGKHHFSTYFERVRCPEPEPTEVVEDILEEIEEIAEETEDIEEVVEDIVEGIEGGEETPIVVEEVIEGIEEEIEDIVEEIVGLEEVVNELEEEENVTEDENIGDENGIGGVFKRWLRRRQSTQ